jgi:hypothetical protein
MTPRRLAGMLGALAVSSPLLLSISPTAASADPAPIRLVATTQPVVDSRGVTWSPDASYASGGH